MGPEPSVVRQTIEKKAGVIDAAKAETPTRKEIFAVILKAFIMAVDGKVERKGNRVQLLQISGRRESRQGIRRFTPEPKLFTSSATVEFNVDETLALNTLVRRNGTRHIGGVLSAS